MVFFSIMNLLDVVRDFVTRKLHGCSCYCHKGKAKLFVLRKLEFLKETGTCQRLCRGHVEDFTTRYPEDYVLGKQVSLRILGLVIMAFAECRRYPNFDENKMKTIQLLAPTLISDKGENAVLRVIQSIFTVLLK
jgi:GDP-D-mannose dehydratase